MMHHTSTLTFKGPFMSVNRFCFTFLPPLPEHRTCEPRIEENSRLSLRLFSLPALVTTPAIGNRFFRSSAARSAIRNRHFPTPRRFSALFSLCRQNRGAFFLSLSSAKPASPR